MVGYGGYGLVSFPDTSGLYVELQVGLVAARAASWGSECLTCWVLELRAGWSKDLGRTTHGILVWVVECRLLFKAASAFLKLVEGVGSSRFT